MLGAYKDGKLKFAEFDMVASCARVPVIDGHLESAVLKLGKDADAEAIIKALDTFRSEPQKLKLELTESVVMENPEQARLILTKLKDIGLGLALAQPDRKVLVLTGDGEMLMGIGALATIAVKTPKNLAIVVQDNEHYGETGMQETATKYGVDLVAMAKGAGFKRTMFVTRPEEVPR